MTPTRASGTTGAERTAGRAAGADRGGMDYAFLINGKAWLYAQHIFVYIVKYTLFAGGADRGVSWEHFGSKHFKMLPKRAL